MAMSYAVVCRLSMILPWAVLALYVGLVYRKKVIQYLLFSTPFAFLLAWYNLKFFGAPWETGYGEEAMRWTGNMWEGFSGLLMSPGRGLFIYTPAFLLSILSFILMLRRWRTVEGKFYFTLSVIGITYVLLMSRWLYWWGGWTWGYRKLVDITPALVLLTIPAITTLGQYKMRWMATFLIALSIGINGLKGAAPTSEMTWRIWNATALHRPGPLWNWRATARQRPRMLWNWRHSPISYQAVGFAAHRLGIAKQAWGWYQTDGFRKYSLQYSSVHDEKADEE